MIKVHTEYKEKQMIISAMIDINNPYPGHLTPDSFLIIED